MPRFPEEIKNFHRALPVGPGGTPAPEWFCELVDVLSADGGWEDSKYEAYHLSGSIRRLPSFSFSISRCPS